MKSICIPSRLVMFCMILIAVVAGYGANTLGEELPMIRIADRHLSVRAIHTPLETLLKRIALESDIEIYLQGRADDNITIDMRRVPLEKGIERLIHGYQHAFTYRYDAGKAVRIKQLYICSPSGYGDFKPL